MDILSLKLRYLWEKGCSGYMAFAISGGPLPEIDIFEMIGSEPNKFYGVVHFEENNMRGRTILNIWFQKRTIYCCLKVGR